MLTMLEKTMTGLNRGNRFREASGVLILTLTLLTLSGASAHLLAIGTQSREATLSGRLLDPAGLPVPGAAIKLLDLSRGSIQTTTTNSRGRFHFQKLDAGEYRLSAATSGFEIIDGLLVEGNYAEGFRAPRFQELFIGGAHFAFPLPEDRIFQAVFIPNPDLKPEKSRNEEVGLRYRRKTLSLRTDYWRAQVENFINFQVVSQTPFPPPGGLLIQKWQAGNVADATLEGVEASMDWDFLPQWTWHAAYSNSRGNDDRTGETLQSVLPEKLVLGLDWKESFLGTTMGLRSRIYDGLSRGEDSFAGYTLHDFHLSWVPPPAPSLTISFGVDNFTDKKYLSPTFGMPGVGRDVRIGFRYRFSR